MNKRNLMVLGTILLLFGAGIIPSISGHTTDERRTIWVPDDYPTIQGAIDAALDGDTVIFRPGTYVENINFLL